MLHGALQAPGPPARILTPMAAPTRSRRISSTPLRPRKRKDKTPAAPPKPAAVGPVPKPDAPPAPVIEFRGVAKEYDSGDIGVEQATFTEGVSMAAQKVCRAIGTGHFPTAWSYLGEQP